ncbi:helix-turn-helix domain-containing protein [Jiangella alkaliphila]|uniref:AraC-type DNA-binding protein n=1 Tax=Jiangella alkaliphila TaxID=419479 RepID=A0A1H2LVF0_9ACTN|nr:AraC family transcriptional regulator [Jiangella alkaliphila]SDU84993.1 AraC-type DNA-binding protein [Jiangella alkaliphila]
MRFEFVSRRPAGLERFVESVWFARGRIDYPSERIAPTGSTVAVVVLGDPIRETAADGAGDTLVTGTGFLIGPHDRPVVNEPLGETYCVGVVSTPVGCEALFGLRPASVRGRVVDLLEVWPGAAPLRAALLGGGTPDAMLELVSSALTAGLRPVPPSVERCERAVAALEAEPARSIGALAAELGVSHGHLDKEFVQVVGVGPRVLARILRLRVVLAGVDVYGPVHWSALAARMGWFDQSHFIRDFRRHTGVTPSAYVAAQRRSFTPEQAAPGFVPDG